ncbi:hypothetical protein MRB53_041770 [Persea americana]|nr:hypothetical protein MRB53_041770 [Persea americana]
MQRLQELKAVHGRNTTHDRGDAAGGVPIVNGAGFLSSIEGARAGQVVVVFVFDPVSPLSQAFGSSLVALAKKHTNARFIALDAETAEIGAAGVPAIIAYRNGDKFASLVPLTEFVAVTCNVVTNLEEALYE